MYSNVNMSIFNVKYNSICTNIHTRTHTHTHIHTHTYTHTHTHTHIYIYIYIYIFIFTYSYINIFSNNVIYIKYDINQKIDTIYGIYAIS